MPPRRGRNYRRAAYTGHRYVAEETPIERNPARGGSRRRNRRRSVQRSSHNVSEETTTDMTDEQDSRPASPHESICFTTSLSSSDVTNAYLLLDKAEAATLTPDPEMVMRYEEDGLYLEDVGDPFKVYDDQKNEYTMQLRVSCGRSTALFWLKGEWDRFVRVNEAKRGEDVTFCRCKNDDDEIYYIVRFLNRGEMTRQGTNDDRERYVKRGLEDDGATSSSDAHKMV